MKLLALALLLCVGASHGKVFDRCELAQELQSLGMGSYGSIEDWVCLTYYESSWNTAATNDNTNGSRDYGIYEINDNYWCDASVGAGADCNVACSDLIDNNISDDSDCAKIIYNRHGYDAWYGWLNNCQGTDLSQWTEGCFKE